MISGCGAHDPVLAHPLTQSFDPWSAAKPRGDLLFPAIDEPTNVNTRPLPLEGSTCLLDTSHIGHQENCSKALVPPGARLFGLISALHRLLQNHLRHPKHASEVYLYPRMLVIIQFGRRSLRMPTGLPNPAFLGDLELHHADGIHPKPHHGLHTNV